MEKREKQRVPDFSNTAIAYENKSDKEIKKSIFVFRLMQWKPLMIFGRVLILVALKLRLPIGFIVKPVIFRHFCGGESIEKSLGTIEKLYDAKVTSVPDFSVEGKDCETSFNRVKDEVIKSIHLASQNVAISFAVFKPTGIASFKLWEKLSNKKNLTENESGQLTALYSRLDAIFDYAKKNDVPVFIDAEETWIQQGIDNIVREYSSKYNTSETVIVYNTVQMYRKDRLDFIKQEINTARANGYRLGYKLVRGAYFEKEHNRAKKSGYPTPLFSKKSDTDNAYDEAIKLCFNNRDHVSFCAATHNESSTKLLTDLIHNSRYENISGISFSQLYGMSDNLTFNLADAGFKVAKYLPYGRVKEVIPYLLRRIEENQSIQDQTNRELNNLLEELKRRKRSF